MTLKPLRLVYARDVVEGHVTTLVPNAANIEGAVGRFDLVIYGVLSPGAKARRLINRGHLCG